MLKNTQMNVWRYIALQILTLSSIDAFKTSGRQSYAFVNKNVAFPNALWTPSDPHSHTHTHTRVKVAPNVVPHSAPTGSDQSLRELMDRACSEMTKKRLSILGSTGSIGTQVLDVVEACPALFEVVGLTGGSNVKLLAQQTIQFKPKIVAIQNEEKKQEFEDMIACMGADTPTLVFGSEGIKEVAAHSDTDTVVTGIVGCAGLQPTVHAIKAGKHIALANKETLIAAGPVIVPLLKKYNSLMTPADSEHSAIFQCLQGSPSNALRRLILTASGGAFRDWKAEDLKNVKLEDALKHPNWSMGAKITIDSATLMNKGLEVIEAHYLFGVGYDNIDVVVHPQSIIHSMVEFQDTSVLGQMGWADMRLPLLYSITWPHRIPMPYKPLDLISIGQLTFKAPDLNKYPCLALAYAAGRQGGTMPAALNAANEQAVQMFRDGKIDYLHIPKIIEHVMSRHMADCKQENLNLQDIIDTDLSARKIAASYQ